MLNNTIHENCWWIIPLMTKKSLCMVRHIAFISCTLVLMLNQGKQRISSLTPRFAIFVLPHRGRHKMAAMFQTTFKCVFVNATVKMYDILLRFHCSLFLMVQLTIFQQWFRLWLCADKATKHCLKQCIIYLFIYASLALNELYIPSAMAGLICSDILKVQCVKRFSILKPQ